VVKTLRKCYRDALDHATIHLCARVARILGCKANWKDTSRLEIEPGAGAMAYLNSERDSADVRARILAKIEAIRVNLTEPRTPNGDAFSSVDSDHEWEIELTGVLAVFAVAACVADLRERFRRVFFAKMRG
jgi:hypothetical protein